MKKQDEEIDDAVSQHPEVMKAMEAAKRKRATMTRRSVSGGGSSKGEDGFVWVNTKFGLGYVLGNATSDPRNKKNIITVPSILVCIPKANITGMECKGPCRHVAVAIADCPDFQKVLKEAEDRAAAKKATKVLVKQEEQNG